MSEDRSSIEYEASSAEDLALRAQAGDSVAMELLTALKMPWVEGIARFFCRSGSVEEAVVDGLTGLLTAVREYKPGLICPDTNRPYNFDWLAWKRVTSAVVQGVADEARISCQPMAEALYAGEKVKVSRPARA